jgi:hypothetical protein
MSDTPCTDCASTWWQQVIKGLVDVIHEWHNLAVVEACEADDEEKRSAMRGKLGERMTKLNTLVCKGEEQYGNVGDVADSQQAAIRAAENTRDCITTSVIASTNKEPLVALYTELAEELERNRNTIETLTDQHVSRGMAVVGRIFDAAIYSVRRVVDASEKSGAERDKACAMGRSVIGPRRGDCQARCTALRTKWDAIQVDLGTFLEDIYEASQVPKIKELADSVFESGRELRQDQDHIDCALRVTFFAERVKDLVGALRDIEVYTRSDGTASREEDILSNDATRITNAIKQLQVETTRLLDEEANHHNDQLPRASDPSGRLIEPSMRATIHQERSSDVARARQVAAKIERDKKIKDKKNQVNRLKGDLQKIQSRAHVQSEQRAQRERLAGYALKIKENIARLQEFGDEVTRYADDCIEIAEREDAVTRSVNNACSRHMCRVAREARALFATTVMRATKDFDGDTAQLARQIQQEMQRFSRTAWRHVGTGRAMVGNGTAPPETMETLDAMQAQNVADINENEALYTEKMRAIGDIQDKVGGLVKDAIKRGG